MDFNKLDSVIPFNSHQESDHFEVGLKLQGGKSILLFKFVGAGDWQNTGPLPDWFYLGDQLEAKLSKENQEHASEVYAELLAVAVGVPMVPIPV